VSHTTNGWRRARERAVTGAGSAAPGTTMPVPSGEAATGIRQSAFETEPWAITESALDLDVIAQSESVFALSNGHIGLRGNLDEGDPHGLPGTYLNSLYELRPLPYAEAGFG
jgi:hypothetical protein